MKKSASKILVVAIVCALLSTTSTNGIHGGNLKQNLVTLKSSVTELKTKLDSLSGKLVTLQTKLQGGTGAPPPPPPPMPGPGAGAPPQGIGGLLAQIQAGKKLKKTDQKTDTSLKTGQGADDKTATEGIGAGGATAALKALVEESGKASQILNIIENKTLDVLKLVHEMIKAQIQGKNDTDEVKIQGTDITVKKLKELAEEIDTKIQVEARLASEKTECSNLTSYIASNLKKADTPDSLDTFIEYFEKGKLTVEEEKKGGGKTTTSIEFNLKESTISPNLKAQACINGFENYLKKYIGEGNRQLGAKLVKSWADDSKWNIIKNKIKIETFNEDIFNKKFQELTGDDKTNFYEKFLDELFHKGTYFCVQINREVTWDRFLKIQGEKTPPLTSNKDIYLYVLRNGDMDRFKSTKAPATGHGSAIDGHGSSSLRPEVTTALQNILALKPNPLFIKTNLDTITKEYNTLLESTQKGSKASKANAEKALKTFLENIVKNPDKPDDTTVKDKLIKAFETAKKTESALYKKLKE